MSHDVQPSPATQASKNVPDRIAAGILGFVLGAGVMFLALQYFNKPPQPAPSPPPQFDTGQFLGAPGGEPDAGVKGGPAPEAPVGAQ